MLADASCVIGDRLPEPTTGQAVLMQGRGVVDQIADVFERGVVQAELLEQVRIDRYFIF